MIEGQISEISLIKEENVRNLAVITKQAEKEFSLSKLSTEKDKLQDELEKVQRAYTEEIDKIAMELEESKQDVQSKTDRVNQLEESSAKNAESLECIKQALQMTRDENTGLRTERTEIDKEIARLREIGANKAQKTKCLEDELHKQKNINEDTCQELKELFN